ncbi:amphi-Trp domain-containing protein [Halospeciosus flavus]|uniref:Amphi-Trp domain-containing protein n=1 Tax=Halospeciosus flavus TaxID=3032283 RepID=A0ABD5YYF9_9EURY
MSSFRTECPKKRFSVFRPRRTQEDIADSLRTLAERLETGEDVTLSAGGESTTVTMPDEP